MCGIAGIFSRSRIDSSNLSEVVQSLGRRGPDARGSYFNESGNLWLGHTRLSIIDLSEAANQPFISESGRMIIVFNGEIYNYKEVREKLRLEKGISFRTTSDTEVISAAFEVWGPEMVKYLDGMFALAIYDVKEQQLFLLKDRVGKKPLYYFISDQFVAFASELKALLILSEIRNQQGPSLPAISHYLHLGYIPEPLTIYDRIFKLKSGHYSIINKSLKFRENSYWSVNQDSLSQPGNANPDPGKELVRLLEKSVEKRLVGDVPIGTFLSGGVDSSLVTAIAGRLTGKPVKTFSVGFTNKTFNEAEFAKRVSGLLKTDHHELLLEEDSAKAILPEYLNYFDEPFADSSAIPMMLVSGMARKHVKVVLTGDGGDELFQGYGAYTWASRLSATPAFAKPMIRQLLKLPPSNRLRRASQMFESPILGGIRSHISSQEQYYFSQREIRNQLLSVPEDFSVFNYTDPPAASNLSPAEQQAIFDIQYYLKDNLLVKVDRASMYHSLECRCPLLDINLISFALHLPWRYKVNGGETKWILKKTLEEYLPKDLIYRPKWGFGIPVASWLKGDLHYLLDDYLNADAIQSTGLFNAPYVASLLHQFQQGRDYLYNRLWLMIVLQRWMLNNNLN